MDFDTYLDNFVFAIDRAIAARVVVCMFCFLFVVLDHLVYVVCIVTLSLTVSNQAPLAQCATQMGQAR